MKARIEVILDVEPCDDDLGNFSEDRILGSVQEAISNALHVAQGNGFSHDLDAELSVMVSEVGKAMRV